MPRALNLLRPGPNYRREAFDRGLQANGFNLLQRVDKPEPGDLLVIWNRVNSGADMAAHFERNGANVLVIENGWVGKTWRGEKWFTVTRSHCGGAGDWSDGGPRRWDSWGVDLEPWRNWQGKPLVFAQRSIGSPALASPPGWAERVAAKVDGRIRAHPGANPPAVSLRDDLADAICCVTWHSAAAMQALLMGVPVFFDCPSWIGAEAGLPLSMWGAEPKRNDEARLSMFRRAAWSLWTEHEIKSGEAIAHLLAA